MLTKSKDDIYDTRVKFTGNFWTQEISTDYWANIWTQDIGTANFQLCFPGVGQQYDIDIFYN